VVAEHGGRVPRQADALLALPGVGRYTAGAIRSIAFNQPSPVLDGNVERVLARLLALRGDVRAGPARRRLWSLAEALIPEGRAGEFNQALMELGALVCTPRGPACERCPVAHLCRAVKRGIQGECPGRRVRAPVPHYEVGIGLVWRRGRLLIARRPARGLLGGLWELPGGKRHGDEPLEETVRRELREELGIRVAVLSRLATCRHAYSHFRVTLHAFQCCCVGGRPRPVQADECRWVAPDELDAYAFPAGTLKILCRLREVPGRKGATPLSTAGAYVTGHPQAPAAPTRTLPRE
jgi:A/G-specific adenine glycosylase